MRKQAARLTQQQFFQVCKAVQDNQAEFQSEKPTLQRAADRIGSELGIEVSRGSVRQAMEATGISWELKGIGIAKKTLEALETWSAAWTVKAHQLESDVAILRRLVHHLYLSLNEKPPAGYVIPTSERLVAANGVK